MTNKTEFSEKDYVVYPTHGVGQLMAIEAQSIGGQELKVFVISFEKNRMTLRLPMNKAREAGLRKLSTSEEVKHAFKILKTHSSIKKGIWSRRAQEYLLKINSGELFSNAKVVKELYPKGESASQSYSERQLYQEALARFCSEIALVENTDSKTVEAWVEETLSAA